MGNQVRNVYSFKSLQWQKMVSTCIKKTALQLQLGFLSNILYVEIFLKVHHFMSLWSKFVLGLKAGSDVCNVTSGCNEIDC